MCCWWQHVMSNMTAIMHGMQRDTAGIVHQEGSVLLQLSFQLAAFQNTALTIQVPIRVMCLCMQLPPLQEVVGEPSAKHMLHRV